MTYHKSFGLAVAFMVAPRLLTRLGSRIPAHVGILPGQSKIASVSHFWMYALLIAMTGTGVGMGYYNGFGVPFFPE